MVNEILGGSGPRALARLGLWLALASAAAPLAAQAPGVPPGQPVPDALELSKLVWSTMAAVDGANRSGNYSVLRDLSAPGFQANNDAARLTGVFAGLRAQNVDLSNTLLLAPTWKTPPAIVGPAMMRLTGRFGLRPIAIDFDLTYQYSSGRWKLFGVTIQPSSLAVDQPPLRPVAAKPPLKPAPRKP